ncbi:MAG: AraC family transcriptional regulator [Planctomycetota bacterium]
MFITTLGFASTYHGTYRQAGGTDEWLFVLFLSDTEAVIDGHSTACPSGSLMAWPPGQPLHYGLPDASFTHHWIRCIGSAVEGWVAASRLPLLQALRMPREDHGCDPWWRHLMDECGGGRQEDSTIAGHCLRILLHHVRRTAVEGLGAVTPDPLLRSRWHIEARFYEQIDVDGLAAMAGLSRAHYSTRFARAFGLPPLAYVIHLRMEHAALLLANPQLRIQQVAARVGYQDPFHFSKQFRKHHGSSPRQYRAGLLERS